VSTEFDETVNKFHEQILWSVFLALVYLGFAYAFGRMAQDFGQTAFEIATAACGICAAWMVASCLLAVWDLFWFLRRNAR